MLSISSVASASAACAMLVAVAMLLASVVIRREHAGDEEPARNEQHAPDP